MGLVWQIALGVVLGAALLVAIPLVAAGVLGGLAAMLDPRPYKPDRSPPPEVMARTRACPSCGEMNGPARLTCKSCKSPLTPPAASPAQPASSEGT